MTEKWLKERVLEALVENFGFKQSIWIFLFKPTFIVDEAIPVFIRLSDHLLELLPREPLPEGPHDPPQLVYADEPVLVLVEDPIFATQEYYHYLQSWALSVFFYFFNNKNWVFCILHQVNNLYLCTSPIKKPTPSQNKLDKNCKKSFFIIEKNKYRKCPALRIYQSGNQTGHSSIGRRAWC